MPPHPLETVVRRLRQAAGPEAADDELLSRFVTLGDETAFSTLVRRHSPLVWSACRRMLADEHAAEDAFQATFFLLARKASSLSHPELLGNWLHGVACRVAARARVESARRRDRERRAPATVPVGPDESFVWREVRGVLDEELTRLPERYRTPLVLCYLEGHTNAEAARRLGCSRGTVATRLARGRDRLRRRLASRGLALPAGLAAIVLTNPALEASTVRAAMLFAAGNLPAAEAVAPQAASLAKGVTTAMLIGKLKLTACVVMVSVTLAGAGLVPRGVVADQPPATEPVRAAEPPAQADNPRSEGRYTSVNFEVMAPTAAIARQIGRAAEERRKAIAQLWLGKELPAWPTRCPINIKIHEQGEGSASTFAFDGGKVISHRMELEGRLEPILTDSLPHEMTHVILAHHFKRPIPRWADEGAAVLSESATSGGRHERLVRTLLDEKRAMPLRELLSLRQYPRDVMMLYGQGYSLTEFLVRSGGRRKFLEFLSEGDRDGWDKAVKARYGHDKVEDLEKAWLASVREPVPERGGTTTKAVTGRTGWSVPRRTEAPRGQLPAGPAPEQALVTLETDGKIAVWRAVTSYLAETTPLVDGKATTQYRPVRTLRPRSYRLDEVKVQDTAGRKLDPNDVAKRLKGETIALVSADGQAVDSLHLRIYKEQTLVFILPPEASLVPATVLPPPPMTPESRTGPNRN